MLQKAGKGHFATAFAKKATRKTADVKPGK